MAGRPPGRAARRLRLVRAVAQALVLLACAQQACTRASSAAQFNGTWESPGGELKLWAVDDGRVRVEFRGRYEYESPAGPMVNVGTAAGAATVDENTATFRPDGAEPDCAITMRVADEALDVRETGSCGFGLNVTAAGTYRRIDTDQPAFDAP
jgi:hypothetical protein